MATIISYKTKPCDWILSDWLTFRFCSPEWDSKKCQDHLSKYNVVSKSKTIFKHIGKFSTLDGQIREVAPKPKSVNNPMKQPTGVFHSISGISAKLVTNMRCYGFQSDSKESNRILNKVYTEDSAFWAITPQTNDRIYIVFTEQFKILRI